MPLVEEVIGVAAARDQDDLHLVVTLGHHFVDPGGPFALFDLQVDAQFGKILLHQLSHLDLIGIGGADLDAQFGRDRIGLRQILFGFL